ncbi:MAG: tetratricopeptide repeat protein, partial [Rhodospirillales bacterium]
RADDAENSYRRALEINPAHATAYFNLGNVLADQERLEDALEAYRKAVSLDNANAEKHYNYANTALKLDRFEDAVESFRRALEIDDEYLDALCNMGSALQSLGRLDEAIAGYHRALSLAGDDDDTTDLHWNLSLALLQNGDYEEGWREYDWRWRTPTFAEFRRDWEKPEWAGEALDGKTVLVHAEQGFGDAIQFCRFAPLVAERGGRVVLESRAPLTRLFGTLEGVAERIDLGAPVPDHDFQVPLMTLPRVFGTTVETVPADVPYLAPPEGAEPDPRIKEAKGLKVGFAWAGSPTRRDNIKRSARLADFEPLFRVEGVTFFSLQVGPFQPELEDLDEGLGVIDLAGGLEDFGDTAAAVQALDLVISVDTAVLHVAGALAKPAWGLMSRPTGFFWMDERTDSSWYPTVRLFRQPEVGDWAPVFAGAEKELAALAKKKA